MNTGHETPSSEHERLVQRHYDTMTKGYYLQWNPDHFHMGLFNPGERPGHNEEMKYSEGLARALERMIEVIVAPAEIDERHHVVDAGCGVGGTAIYLARMHGCRVTGINLSRVQLELADKKALDADLDDRVRFEYADCSRYLPFTDASVDVVVNMESARHYSDRRRFLSEVYRILKPGGKIVATDWMCRDGLKANQYDIFIRPLCKAWLLHDLESQFTYTRLLHEAGLEVIEFEGFGGKVLDNLHILKNIYQSFRLIRLSGINAPSVIKVMDRTAKIHDAWRNTCFDIRRYYALKPQ
ncbi:MAG: methyltransferase domain-containing protein [Gammaproteobacteria bacterium]|nr:methyltransferase domain-containing protein [Gammaproteobacteria bacterium]MDE0284994.1 methyltransferase domain-containing protein [Gammaproteobacteria bacterium]MDE0512567.1 methyltransferase domain-containing protein [Gammaproteobacteria bacterium]